MLGKYIKLKFPSKRFSLAMTVVLASFLLIGYMLSQQEVIVKQTFQLATTANLDNATSANLITLFEKLDKSNQTIFNILLPVFSAWVGVVLAFYFGTRSLDKAQEVNERAQEIISKLATGKGGDITLEELLKLYPESKNVQIVKLDYEVEAVKGQAKVFGNVVVIDDKKKILGVLYLKDLVDAEKERTGEKKKGEKLKDFFTNAKPKDNIIDQTWEKKRLEKENFARLSFQDKISEARTKMEKISKERDVLGLIIEKDEVEAAINYKTLLRYL